MNSPGPPPDPAPHARKLAFGQTVRAVAWSFLGIRRSSGLERDAQLNPVHIVVAAVLGAAVFIIVLVLLVHWITAPASAT